MQFAGLILGILSLIQLCTAACRGRYRERRIPTSGKGDQRHCRPRLIELADSEGNSRTWSGPRSFVVRRRVEEADQVLSLYLEPQDGKPLPSFAAGQFIGVAVNIPGQPSPVKRCYSLSNAPHSRYYRITVKRVSGGLVSGFIHDQLLVGGIVQVHAPAGQFVLTEESSRELVLIAGGIGVTPFLSMLEVLAKFPGRRATLFYSVRNGRDRIQRDSLEELMARAPWLRIVTIYTQPEDTDILGLDYNDSTRLTAEAIRNVVPELDAEFYLCGSVAMTTSLVNQLRDAGVSEEWIHVEGFGGPPQPRKAIREEKRQGDSSAPEPIAAAPKITFSKSGTTVTCDQPAASILEVAEQHGIELESMCRSGNCGACRLALLSGRVAGCAGQMGAVDGDSCLPCVARPVTDIVLHA